MRIIFCILVIFVLIWAIFITQEQTITSSSETDETNAIDLTEQVSKADSIYVENADIGHYDGDHSDHGHEEYWEWDHENHEH